MEWCNDDAERYRVDSDIARRELHRETARCGDACPLRERGHHCGHGLQRMLDEARRYLNDVTAALLLHRRDRRLRRKEDTAEIGPHRLAIQIFGDVFDATGQPDAG